MQNYQDCQISLRNVEIQKFYRINRLSNHYNEAPNTKIAKTECSKPGLPDDEAMKTLQNRLQNYQRCQLRICDTKMLNPTVENQGCKNFLSNAKIIKTFVE